LKGRIGMKKTTRDEVQKIILDAMNYGRESVLADKISGSEIMGGAYIILEVDARTSLGRILSSFENDSGCGFNLSKSHYFKAFTLSSDKLHFLHVTPSKVACGAALQYLQSQIAIEGWVHDYESD